MSIHSEWKNKKREREREIHRQCQLFVDQTIFCCVRNYRCPLIHLYSCRLWVSVAKQRMVVIAFKLEANRSIRNGTIWYYTGQMWIKMALSMEKRTSQMTDSDISTHTSNNNNNNKCMCVCMCGPSWTDTRINVTNNNWNSLNEWISFFIHLNGYSTSYMFFLFGSYVHQS